MTKSEEEALKHPPLHPDANAVAGMAQQAELTKKQRESNTAAGVDSRGVPIAKSSEKGEASATPPP